MRAALWFSDLITFSFDQVMKSLNSNIFIVLQCVPLGTGYVFLFCSVGSYTTDNFLRFADISYESLWYKFPPDLQKYLRLIIADAQRPQVFRGFGIVDLNLMAFAKVNKLRVVWRFVLLAEADIFFRICR